MSSSRQFAFVTLVTSDSYLPGALVVAAALRDIHPSPPTYPDEFDPSEFDRVCLVTPETVDVSTVKHLRRAFDVIIGVEVIEEENEEGLKLLGRLDLKTVLTKLHVFRLTSYRKIIFLDADVLTLRPISHLFRTPASFAAVPDVGWPDIFNSGFLVLEPSEDKFNEVIKLVKSKGSWDGGDQGVLNEWAGKNWERLSFTYNTTPTAVYTYAPAYKRFGSQISNIHFIGPNKPWSQIASREPGSSSISSTISVPSQQFFPPSSYGYPALLDRWFDVYDRHYRPSAPTNLDTLTTTLSPTLSSKADLSASMKMSPVPHYKSQWELDVPSNHAGAEGSGDTPHVPLGLEELRRMAIEGVGTSEVGSGEGAYRSLPLEGRVDLMRPIKPQPEPVPEELAFEVAAFERKTPPAVTILVPPGPHTPLRAWSPMTTLPTPGPNEFPPKPVFRGKSLPPETPTHASHSHGAHFHGTPDHNRLQLPFGPSSSSRSHSPTHSPSPSPLRPVSSPPPRRSSPPLLSWNPAIEAPPTAPPPASHFPEETYFPNVWDARSQDHHPLAPEESGGFFPLPPPSDIPEMLIREGHYKNVIGERTEERHQHSQPHQEGHTHQQDQQQQDKGRHSPTPHQNHEYQHTRQLSHPRPDRSKVAVVFPWEENPRHAPERFFPRTDSPPPGQPFIKPESPALRLEIQPRVSPSATAPPPLPQGFPRTTTYANAWDAIPSIQRYAARLVRPTPAPAPAPEWTGRTRKGSAATAGGNEYRSWQDRAEVSSRDADDEDEGDDEDERSPPSIGAESDKSEGEARLPGPSYMGRGVQTMAKDVKHQGVQVRSEEGISSPRAFSGSRSTQIAMRETSSDEEWPHPPAMRHTSSDATARNPAAPDVQPFRTSSVVPKLLPATVKSAGPAPTADQFTPPLSSFGPVSPPEGAPLLQALQSTTAQLPRRVGRTFDPAREVDVFKRGSEEVLARFLKMGSWEDDMPSPEHAECV
ncbi:glycosyltransferase family 8 protein [Ramaria rubella]|nr:glycosyltransferase family 8 protein [Ramaria rubella]